MIPTIPDALRISKLTGRSHALSTRDRDSEEERAQVVRELLARCEPGDTLILGDGDFRFGQGRSVDFRGLNVRGQGLTRTHCLNRIHSDAEGAAYIVGGPDVTIVDLSLESVSSMPHEDDQCVSLVGHGDRVVEPHELNWQILFLNARLTGQAWTFYNWSNNLCVVSFRSCQILSGRIALNGQGTGGTMAQNYNVHRCVIDVDVARCQSHGHISQKDHSGVMGACLRSGRHVFEDNIFRLRNTVADAHPIPVDERNFAPPRTVGITDIFESKAGDTFITARRNLFDLEPGGAPEDRCHVVELSDRNKGNFIGEGNRRSVPL